MIGSRIRFLAMALSISASSLVGQRHVQIRTRSLGWPSGWLVKEEPARLGLVLDYHADTVWIPRADIVGLEYTGAPTLTDASLEGTGGARGPRVKLIQAHGTQVGLLAAQDSARIGLVPDGRADTTWLLRSAVTEVQVSVGKKSGAGTGAGVGAITGAVLGGVAAGNAYKPCAPQPGPFGSLSCIGDTGQGGAIVLGALGGAIGGALLGAAIGSFSKHDQWERVDPGAPAQSPGPRLSLMPVGRGVAVAVTVSVR